jgi:hypothetical protein
MWPYFTGPLEGHIRQVWLCWFFLELYFIQQLLKDLMPKIGFWLQPKSQNSMAFKFWPLYLQFYMYFFITNNQIILTNHYFMNIILPFKWVSDYFISIKPGWSDHLAYVTIFHWSLGRSHKAGLTMLILFRTIFYSTTPGLYLRNLVFACFLFGICSLL